jgi:hypothetical protein
MVSYWDYTDQNMVLCTYCSFKFLTTDFVNIFTYKPCIYYYNIFHLSFKLNT